MLPRFSIGIVLFLFSLNSVNAGPHEIQATGQLGLTAPELGLSGQMGASFRMDDTLSLDAQVVFVQGFSETGIQRLFGGTVGATYQLDVTQFVPFLQFGVGAGHLRLKDEGRPTLIATLGVGFVYRWSDRMDVGGALSKLSDLGLSESLSPPMRLDLVLRYRFER